MVLVVATIGMTVVVLARNIIDHLGMGLIPVVILCFVLVFVGLWYENKGCSRPLSAVSDFSDMPQKHNLIVLQPFFMYWILNIVFQSIKVVRIQQLNQLDPGKKSRYPSSDQLLNNAVILGCYVAFLFIEGFVFVLSRRPAEPAYYRPELSKLNKIATV
ncbi:hypothetical protein PILCRDRAFT_317054 [Piloderma croceum F 1598]|uniref:Uncharacterized protein n=1 Tax=Piloderma croceum (strain F 1598) TaxID=765440 RepID=A0A0C3BKA4_PILCF|nr:hypothetical protein PILCRDRAFT_317054 [Piloderma croceum F 1598]